MSSMQLAKSALCRFVVSRKRVYLGHYWEDVSFGKKPRAKYRLQFATQVTKFLKTGFTVPSSPGHDSIAQDSLAQHSEDFKGDPHLVAWILSPKAELDEPNPGGFLYASKAQRMVDTVASILGIDANEVKLHAYEAVDKARDTANVLGETAAGRLVSDYDPKAGDRKEPVSWRIIWQNGILDLQQWAAPKPKPPVGR